MGLYPSRPRTRIVPASVVTGDAALFARLTTPEYDAPVEQAIVIHVEAWDRNCQQHIPRLIRLVTRQTMPEAACVAQNVAS